MTIIHQKDISIESDPIGPTDINVNTKNDKKRKIEIPASLMSCLYFYLISERRIKRAMKENYGEYEPLFINQSGKPYSPESINVLWSNLRKRIRKEQSTTFDYKFHDARASYGTYRLNSLLDHGLNPSEAMTLIMGWMGHEDESTTWKYLRYLRSKEARQSTISVLDDIMEGAVNGV